MCYVSGLCTAWEGFSLLCMLGVVQEVGMVTNAIWTEVMALGGILLPSVR